MVCCVEQLRQYTYTKASSETKRERDTWIIPKPFSAGMKNMCSCRVDSDQEPVNKPCVS